MEGVTAAADNPLPLREGAGGGVPVLTPLRHALNKIATAMAYIAGWNYIVCSLLITFDVVARRHFGMSSKATVEISGYCLAGGIAWGLAHALAQRCHIRVDVLVNRFPPGIRRFLHALALLLLCVFAVFIAWAALSLAEESVLFDAHDNTALSIPLILPQGVWAVAIVFFAVLVIVMSVEVLLLLATGQGAEVEKLLGPRTLQDETKEALEAVAMARQSKP